MMRLRLSINGVSIGDIGVHNTGEYDGTDVKYDVYDLRGTGTTVTDLTSRPHIMTVWHDRRDGAAALGEHILSELPEGRLDDYQ